MSLNGFLRYPPTHFSWTNFLLFYIFLFFGWVSQFKKFWVCNKFQLVKRKSVRLGALNVHNNYEPWNPKPHVRMLQPLFVITPNIKRRCLNVFLKSHVSVRRKKKQIFTLKWLSGRSFSCGCVSRGGHRFIEKGKNGKLTWMHSVQLWNKKKSLISFPD